MIKNDLLERLNALEASITGNTFEFCRAAIEDGLLLKRNKKTGEIIEIDPDTDIPINSYIIIFPEIEIYGLYKNIDKFDALNPFDKWFLLKTFNAKDEASLMKAIKKYWKQIEREDEERRAAIEVRLASKKQIEMNDKNISQIPIKSSKPIAIKSNEPIPETQEQRVKRIKQNIMEDFGIGAFHNESLF